MLAAASANGWIDREPPRSRRCFAVKRAGADLILTYLARRSPSAQRAALAFLRTGSDSGNCRRRSVPSGAGGHPRWGELAGAELSGVGGTPRFVASGSGAY